MSLPPLQTNIDEFIYQGIAGPLLFRSDGNIGLARDRSLLTEEMIAMVLTLFQEIFMEPADGVGLDQYLFEPNDPDTYNIVGNYLRDRMNNLDDRIAVDQISFRPDDTGARMLVLILWKIRADTDQTGLYELELSADVGVQEVGL